MPKKMNVRNPYFRDTIWECSRTLYAAILREIVTSQTPFGCWSDQDK